MKKTIKITLLVILVALTGFLIYQNHNKEQKINSLELKINELKEKQNKTSKYNKNLDEIKTIKQTIMGQENKIEELNTQVQKITDIYVKNKEKLDKYE